MKGKPQKSLREEWADLKRDIKTDWKKGPTLKESYREARAEQKRKEAEKRAYRMEHGYHPFIRYSTAAISIIDVIIAIPIALTIIGLPISFVMIAVSLWMWNKYVTPGGKLL